MNTTQNDSAKIWGFAAIAGVVALIILLLFTSYTFWPSLLLAILIAVLVAILLWIGFYRDAGEDQIDDNASDNGPATAPANAVKDATSKAAPPAADPTPAKSAAPIKPAAKAKSPDAAKTGAPKGETAKASPASSSAQTTSSTKKAPKAAAKKASKSEKKAPAKPAPTPVAKDGKPPVLTKARAGGADDLKLIKGVGPALEKTLNELGFYHYDQVAAWRKKEINWVDERLRFKGRIERDGWVKQSKSLAKGEATEFSKRAK